MKKPFTIGILREITDQYESGDISYAKMVEMLNEIAMKWHEQTISKMETTQTAVDWFYQRILAKDIKEVFEQAKQMEKEQMKIKLPTDDEVEEGLFHHSNEYAIGYKDAIEFVKQLNYGSNNKI